MTTEEKKIMITAIVTDMINDCHDNMKKKIERAFASGALDVDSWDPTYEPTIIPRIIVLALLREQIWQNDARGTKYERRIRKEVNNLVAMM